MSRARLLLQMMLLILCLAVLAVTAHAQYRAGIQGSVTDPHGALVPDATVTLTSNETNVSHTAKTSETGVYTFPGLAPGAYKLSVEKTGFSKKILENVLVSAEQMRSLNVELDMGQVTESVTVTERLSTADRHAIGGSRGHPDSQRDDEPAFHGSRSLHFDTAYAGGFWRWSQEQQRWQLQPAQRQ